MAQRGRGCLEIKDSSNPFFTTTNSVIGTSTKHLRTFDAPPVFRMMNKPDPVAEGIDWSFMYMKESDRIGAGVPASDSKLAVAAASVRESPAQRAKEKSMGKHPVLYEREEDTGVPLRDATCYELQPRVPADKDVREALLSTFKHSQKVETPLYSTANNEIGIKRPTAATFTFERRAQQQGFSNSFGGINYRDMGLNTTITRSNVHDALNHSFI